MKKWWNVRELREENKGMIEVDDEPSCVATVLSSPLFMTRVPGRTSVNNIFRVAAVIDHMKYKAP